MGDAARGEGIRGMLARLVRAAERIADALESQESPETPKAKRPERPIKTRPDDHDDAARLRLRHGRH